MDRTGKQASVSLICPYQQLCEQRLETQTVYRFIWSIHFAHRKHNYVYTTESFSRHYYSFTSIAVRCDVRSCALLTCSTCTNFNFFLWKYLISNVNLFFYIYVICELKSFFFQIMISGDKYIGCIIGEVVNFYLRINRELFLKKLLRFLC